MSSYGRREIIGQAALAFSLPLVTAGPKRLRVLPPTPQPSVGPRSVALNAALLKYGADGIGSVVAKNVSNPGSLGAKDFLKASRHAKLVGHHIADAGIDSAVRAAAEQGIFKKIDVQDPAISGAVGQTVQDCRSYDPSFSAASFQGLDATSLNEHLRKNGLSVFLFDAAYGLKAHATLTRVQPAGGLLAPAAPASAADRENDDNDEMAIHAPDRIDTTDYLRLRCDVEANYNQLPDLSLAERRAKAVLAGLCHSAGSYPALTVALCIAALEVACELASGGALAAACGYTAKLSEFGATKLGKVPISKASALAASLLALVCKLSS